MMTSTDTDLWEDETAREKTDHPASYAEAKKMQSGTVHTHDCLQGRPVRALCDA